VPVFWGEPRRTPVAESSCNPAGSPERIAQVYGLAPPDAENVCAYWTPTTPVNRGDTVVIASGGTLIVSESEIAVDCCPAESVTCKEKVEVPGVVGVPEMVPRARSSVRPAGRAPCTMLH